MKLDIPNYLKMNILNSIKNGSILLGLFISIIPSIAITYSILELNGPFTISHVAHFFCIFGIVVPVIIASSMFLKDFHFKTISIFYTSFENRISYFISNIILAGIVGCIFGVTGSLLLNLLSSIGVEGEISIFHSFEFILNFIFCIVFYGLFAYVLALLFEKSSIVYIILILGIEILPNLLESIRAAVDNRVINSLIDNFPFYSLLIYLPTGNLTITQYVNLAVGIVVLFGLGAYLTSKKNV